MPLACQQSAHELRMGMLKPVLVLVLLLEPRLKLTWEASHAFRTLPIPPACSHKLTRTRLPENARKHRAAASDLCAPAYLAS